MTTYIIIGSLLLLIIIFSYFRNKQAKTKVIRVVHDNCTGCQRCLKKCRHKALQIKDANNKRSIVVVLPDRCTACKDCIAACKFNALKLIDRKQA